MMDKMIDKFSFNKIDIQDLIVIIALAGALFMSISYDMKELAMSIASGLLGYIGGTAASSTKKETTSTTTNNTNTTEKKAVNSSTPPEIPSGNLKTVENK